jgi:acetyl-CoA carboxylase, biotin carboxylase subunit
LGLSDGRVVALGERECSVQRRFQKVIEESPSAGVDQVMRSQLTDAAVKVGEAVGYRNAGTVEFLVSGENHVFLEVNARLQVEHPVTELVTGLDLVAEQLRIASGRDVSFKPDGMSVSGHAIELRIYAEDPETFLPSPGRLAVWAEPSGDGIRMESTYQQGDAVSPYYDPLLAKLCTWAADRPAAIGLAIDALRQFEVEGVRTNIPFLGKILESSEFHSGDYDTGITDRVLAAPTDG